jgi:hypothetical protein
MNEVCDFVYAYDQNSTDQSRDVYESLPNWNVIYSDKNNFLKEIFCKAELMGLLLSEHPDVDWIFWMDGDTILDGRVDREEMEYMLNEGSEMQGIVIPHFNLWRSDIYYRVDNSYHAFSTHGVQGVLSLWNAKKAKMEFKKEHGIHKTQSPDSIRVVAQSCYGLVHRGFATDMSIIRKYENYARNGMRGWDLERLLDERTLEVCRIENDMIPAWFKITDTENPRTKTPILEIYKEKLWKR